jgi:hypothetical protein
VPLNVFMTVQCIEDGIKGLTENLIKRTEFVILILGPVFDK